MPSTEVSKKVGENWSKMTMKEKVKYNEMADEDKVRHQKQMEELMSKGFFVNEEGVKSTDLKVKKKRTAASSANEKPRSNSNKRKANTEPVEEMEKVLNKKSPKRVRKE